MTILIFFLGYKLYLDLLTSLGVRLIYSGATPLPIMLLAGTVRLFPALLALWIGARFLDRRKISAFGLKINFQWLLDLGCGIGLGSLMVTTVFVLELAMGWVHVNSLLHTGAGNGGFLFPLLTLLFFIFCQALFEELLARGYLYRNLAEGMASRKFDRRKAELLSWLILALLFGLAHIFNPNATLVSTLNLVMIGVTFGAGIYFTGSLALPIGLHFGWNFFLANIYGYPLSGFRFPAEIVSLLRTGQSGPAIWTGGKFGPEGGLLGTFAILLGLILTVLWGNSACHRKSDSKEK